MAAGSERKLFRWKAEEVGGDSAEFVPYGCHVEFFKLLLEQGGVDLAVVLVQVHCPVADLAEADAFCGHVPYGMMEDEECVEGRCNKLDDCAVVVPFVESVGAEVCIDAFFCPLLQAGVQALAWHHVGVTMYFDLYAVEAHVHVVVRFCRFLVFLAVVQPVDYPACLFISSKAGVQVDVSAAAARGLAIVLRHSLAFQEN